jgi:asparagine synthetase B (glutamine-hydrolysing)
MDAATMAELSRYRSMLKTKMNPRVFWGASLIVGLLAELGQKDLMTFSVGFEEANGEKGDEFVYSDLIAKHYGTKHHQIFVPHQRLMEAGQTLAPVQQAQTRPRSRPHPVLIKI